MFVSLSQSKPNRPVLPVIGFKYFPSSSIQYIKNVEITASLSNPIGRYYVFHLAGKDCKNGPTFPTPENQVFLSQPFFSPLKLRSLINAEKTGGTESAPSQ